MNTPASAASPPPILAPRSALRAWLFLVGFSLRRQAQVRQLVAIALALLALTCLIIGLVTANVGWDRSNRLPFRLRLPAYSLVAGGLAAPVIDQRDQLETFRRESAPLAVFSRWVVFFLFLGFLLPLWNLSFATSALGTERESRSLVWLLTRPLPRAGIYLAKFLAVLPWCLALNLAGFALVCLAGGSTGRQALALYWPAVLAGSLAFTAVFHLIGALFARPAVVALLYSFFFETILSELPVPGTLKRLSINYYARCLMYSEARAHDVPTESASLFVPVSDSAAWAILLGATVALTALGMYLFGRVEYRDEI